MGWDGEGTRPGEGLELGQNRAWTVRLGTWLWPPGATWGHQQGPSLESWTVDNLTVATCGHPTVTKPGGLDSENLNVATCGHPTVTKPGEPDSEDLPVATWGYQWGPSLERWTVTTCLWPPGATQQ